MVYTHFIRSYAYLMNINNLFKKAFKIIIRFPLDVFMRELLHGDIGFYIS